TMREYALEQLDAAGEREVAERAHAAYFLALAEQVEPHLKGPEQVGWYQRLQREQDNLRAVLAWAAAHDESEVELRLAGCLTYFWWASGDLHQVWQWLEDALARSAGRCNDLLAGHEAARGVAGERAGARGLADSEVLSRELQRALGIVA